MLEETQNQKRARLLGEPFGTANSRLRKMLLFDMATRLDEVWCYRCSYRITTLEEFSIEHTIPWQGTENPKETFFDLSKIKFSHLSCNSAASYKNNKSNIPYVERRKEINKRYGINRKLDKPRYDRMLRMKRERYQRESS